MASEYFEPYVGPRPFETEDRHIFFGRPGEVHAIVSLIIAHQAVIIHSPSGAGKTSLLKAGVIPNLREHGFESLLGRVRQLYPTQVAPEDIPNIFIFNYLLSFGVRNADPAAFASVTLAEHLKRMERSRDEIGQLLPLVLIFDQLEELFTTHLDRWQDRQTFFDQIGRALDVDHLLRVAFLLREEFVAQIEPYSHVLHQGTVPRFRVEPMRAADALRAVTAPLAATGRSFAEGVAEKLVTNLTQIQVKDAKGNITVVPGEFVNPVQLQIVMQNLWNKLPADESIITDNAISDGGHLDVPLARFYEKVLREAVSRSPEVSEEVLRKWFERSLVSPVGMRSQVVRGEVKTAGIPNQVVDDLVNSHLLRAERVGGAFFYELSHDRFVRPIQDSNERFFSK